MTAEEQASKVIALLHVVWVAVIGRWARATDFVNGVGLADDHEDGWFSWLWGRVHARHGHTQELTETFPNSIVPMRVVTVSDDGVAYTAAELLQKLGEESQMLSDELEKSGPLNYTELLTSLGLSLAEGKTHPLFQTAFVVGPALSSAEGMLAALTVASPESAPLALQLRVRPCQAAEDVVQVQLFFHEDLISAASARHLQQQIVQLFKSLTAGPGLMHKPLVEVPLADPSSLADLRRWSDATDHRRFKPGQVHDYFIEEAAKEPQRVALVCSDDAGEQVWTYGQLMQLSRQLRDHLQSAHGVGFDVLVPLLFERGLEMIVAVYGVILAGGAYVPLEPFYPRSRILSILEDVAPSVTITVETFIDLLTPSPAAPNAWAVIGLGSTHLMPASPQALGTFRSVRSFPEATLPSCTIQIQELVRRKDKAPQPPSDFDTQKKQAAGNGLVYCFFTSGSTGKPKGVMVEHAGLRHRIEWLKLRYGHAMQPGDCTVLKHAYTFGISEWEMFWPLAAGGTLIVPKPGGEKDPQYMFRLCATYQVKVIFFVPSLLNMLFDYMQGEDKDATESGVVLQHIITCGEALPEDTIQRHFQLMHSAELDNLFGPTEGSMTVWRCPRGRRVPIVPIGAPIDGARVLTLTQGHLAEVNIPGEIHWAGQFIARGYLGQPSLTESVFKKDAIFSDRYPGELMYASGDLACWKPNGQLQFLGRGDNQIKLRGFRIEIGDIESAVKSTPGVKETIVVLSGEGETKFLAAYITPLNVNIDIVKATCVSKLPHYMVPSAFMPLEKLPVTDRGKLDKKALPPAKMGPAADAGKQTSVVVPKTEMGTLIVEIFSEILGRPKDSIGMESDFVSIGGNSVLAGKVTSRLRKTLSIPLPGTALYKLPTPSQLEPLLTELVAVRKAQEGEELGTEADSEYQYAGMSASRTVAVILTALMPLAQLVKDFSGFFDILLLVAQRYLYDKLPAGWGLASMLLIRLVGDPLFMVMDLLVALFLKVVFVGRLKSGPCPVFSVGYFKWLYSKMLVEAAIEPLLDYFVGTPVLNLAYRLFGADIRSNVVIMSRNVISEPELLCIQDGAMLEDESKVVCSSIIDGELLLEPVLIGQCSRARPYSTVGRGAHLPEGHELVARSCLVGYGTKNGLVTCGKLAKLRSEFVHPPVQEPWLRVLVGAPLLLLLDTLASAPLFLLGFKLMHLSLPLWLFLLAFLGEHVHRASLVIITILAKWTLVGKVQPCDRAEQGSWSRLLHWVVEAMLDRKAFKDAMEPYINTEVLRLVFVCLGMSIGRRACMDMIACNKPDLLSIGDHVVFGSSVGIICEDEHKRLPVQICRAANVLDNCVLMPGVTVGQRAILGTNTLAAPEHYFPPDTINTGNKNGASVFLRKKGKGPAETEAKEADANRRLESRFTWSIFNIGLIAVALMEPLLKSINVLPFIAAYCAPIELKYKILLGLLVAAVEDFIEAFILFTMKWCVIGKFRESEVVFFGLKHFLWMAWLMVSSTFDHLEGFHGTALYSTFLRAMGSTVGSDCSLFGFTLEFDLLHIGDRVHVGFDCDNTCHTVEAMVLKMVPIKLASGSSMQEHSFVMPGAELSERAVLLEESQVLKGDIVPEGDIWLGNPAEPIKLSRGKLREVPRLLDSAR